jgi:hypothetical protein
MSRKAILAALLTAAIVAGGSGASALAAPTATPKASMATAVGSAPQGVDLGNQGIINLILDVRHTLEKIRILNHVKSIRIITIQRSLNRVINKSDILSHRVLVLHHFLRNCDVVACFKIQDFLNKNNVKVGDIVAVEVLSNDNIRLFGRP